MTERNPKKSLKEELKSSEYRECKCTRAWRKKWKVIFRTCKNAMRKWRPCINSILKNLTTTWRSWRKRDKKTTPIMKSLRKSNVYWTPNCATWGKNTTVRTNPLKNKTRISLLSIRESPVSSSNSRESSSISRKLIYRDTMKSKPWTKSRFKNTKKRSLSAT